MRPTAPRRPDAPPLSRPTLHSATRERWKIIGLFALAALGVGLAVLAPNGYVLALGIGLAVVGLLGALAHLYAAAMARAFRH